MISRQSFLLCAALLLCVQPLVVMAGKGKKGSNPHCRNYEFVVKRSEITRYIADGVETSYAPIYSFEDDDYMHLTKVGVTERKVQFINRQDSSEGAMLWFTQSFEWDAEREVYESQLSTVGTADGDINSVVGGFGAFSCAIGTETHTVIELEDGDKLVRRDIHVCGGCGNKMRALRPPVE